MVPQNRYYVTNYHIYLRLKKKCMREPQFEKGGSQKEIENMNRPITSTKSKTVIKNRPTNKSPGPDGFTVDLYQMFREELIPILLWFIQKITERGTFPNSFHGVTITLISKGDKDITQKWKVQGNTTTTIFSFHCCAFISVGWCPLSIIDSGKCHMGWSLGHNMVTWPHTLLSGSERTDVQCPIAKSGWRKWCDWPLSTMCPYYHERLHSQGRRANRKVCTLCNYL